MFKKLIDGKKAVLFDVDGTLVDSVAHWDQAMYNVLQTLDHTVNYVEDFPTGQFLQEKWERLLKAYPIKTNLNAKELANRTCDEFLALLPKYGLNLSEGFLAFAAELKVDKNFKLGVTSNSPRRVVEAVLAAVEIDDIFDLIVGVDEVAKPKPNPTIYKVAAKKLRLKPKEILVFEDSVTGAKSACRAKMDVVIIWDGNTLKEKYPRQVLGFTPSFDGLAGNLDDTFEDRFDTFAEKIKEINQKTPTPTPQL